MINLQIVTYISRSVAIGCYLKADRDETFYTFLVHTERKSNKITLTETRLQYKFFNNIFTRIVLVYLNVKSINFMN